MSETLRQAIELSRNELLDMGLRGNSLLHFRGNAKSIEVIDEIASQVYSHIVTDSKPMYFAPLPDALTEGDEQDRTAPLPLIVENLEELYGTDRHSDNKLQTKLDADSLDKKLLKINTEADTYYHEQGIDILYLALGFLTWYEDRNSDKPRSAPLVLVPVQLQRLSAKDRFKLSFTDGDMGANLTLAAKLKMEFQVALPDFAEDFNFDDYIESCRETVKSQPRWEVEENRIALGFFSFGKFQMYQDLDPEKWPDDKKPESHPIVKSLMGGGFSHEENGSAGADGSDGGSGSQGIELTQLNFVKDSDSSQTEAALAVKSGKSLVIQGPPGTGKSQTITNIIAEAIADNKRILFVAEKMAALEVVKSRLDECHLGDAVLELHSHKSNKRVVLEELKRTLELGKPNTPDRLDAQQRHKDLQTQLDAYSNAVNSEILKSGTTYIDALGLLLALKKETAEEVLPTLDFSTMESWTREDFVAACQSVQELINHLQEMGRPSQNPFSKSGLMDFSPAEQAQLLSLLQQTKAKVLECMVMGKSLATEMGLSEPTTLKDVSVICRAANRAIKAPHLKGLTLTTQDWQQRRDQIRALTDAGAGISQLKEKRSADLIDQAWKADVLETRQVWATVGTKWWRIFSGNYRRAKLSLAGLSKSPLPKEQPACLEILDDILQYQTLSEVYQRHSELGERLFGAQWQGEQSDWTVLQSLSDWVNKLYDEIGKGQVPEGLIRFLEGDRSLSEWSGKLQKLEDAAISAHKNLSSLKSRIDLADDDDIVGYTLSSLNELMQSWVARIDDLYLMTRYNRIRQNLKDKNLDEIGRISFDWKAHPDYLLNTLKIAWYEGLITEAYQAHEPIKQFDRISHEACIQEFKELDESLFTHAQESLVVKHYTRMPNPKSPGEMGIIRNEINKKRRHLPLRKLIRQAGRAIQEIKPVFMMSPMSVATYLEQGAIEFDLVIFDEASQVKVVDALGPILRGKQVVVVGDTKQMPPTDFFGKALELDDEEAEESFTADIESILSMFLSQGAPESMLRWHYRSRHESLITVSNHEFYDNKLLVFPSPGVNAAAKGLSFVHTEGTFYQRGTSRTNPEEARIVAEAVMKHARSTPDISLGVVAFSTAQRDRILLELERLRREDDSCEEFFNRSSQESFFVKNLENVQGDERDTIFISIGYGKTESGNVSRSFGPINREGGHRRLNVLITRAKMAMRVFCNFTADELATTASTPFGVKALKSFLKYAETGVLEDRRETGKDTDSPFEDEVISAIQGLGYDVEPQVGSAGFFIDIAIRDPKKTGRYLLAVECDGASYHSSATARDRDRLRQNVLEGLGWRFHRIWSTDWFRNQYKEIDRLKESIDKARAYYDVLDQGGFERQTSAPVTVESPSIERIEESGDENDLSPNAYKVCDSDIGIPIGMDVHEIPRQTIEQAIRKIVQIEGPIHVDETARRITERAGFTRVGARIKKHVMTAVEAGHRTGNFHKSGYFIYKSSEKEVEVRDRSELPTSMKKIELVSPEEIKLALLDIADSAFSINIDALVSEALSKLGFQRATSKARSYVSSILYELAKEGRLILENEVARTATTNA